MPVPHPYWLRDNCPCTECRNPRSGQKRFRIGDLPDGLTATEAVEDAAGLHVLWSDGHRSCYPAGWDARDEDSGLGDHRTEHGKRLWEAADFARGLPEADWPTYLADPEERIAVLAAVRRSGFAVLRGVPVEERRVLDVARTFGYVRDTNYGELFDVRVEPDAVNFAFTDAAVAPHTDNPYRDPVPTLQLLHCLRNDAAGGDSGLVDGFRAAALLRAEDPEAFALLARTPVPFRYRDRTADLAAEMPMIGLDPRGAIREIRFNNRSIDTLRSLRGAELDAFYAAYRRFAEITLRPELQLEFRLGPGDCLIFDNTRLLHARTAFEQATGGRHLQGCYADLDSLSSTLSVLRRNTAALDELEALFAGEGAGEYLGEAVTMAEHMLQAGALARAAGAPPALVAAALLHDIGHFHGSGLELMAGTDNRHGETAADWLSRYFPAAVTEPVRLHVPAKRYLCTAEPGYFAKLSPASVHTLSLQGGPMTPEDAAAFAAGPFAADAIAVRRWDEAAKDPAVSTPPFAEFRPLLLELMG
ncbi:2-trimethylaminoethylphosphonate dioxygenase [Kitasatospora cheerisanensis]|uniref:Putative gamma-butyrobetaine dioxygenase n=1 Tax=Kitasatospora cheerisanensis KCTC 2395 TaxID=1348663 RepID=A0A066YMM8_9ACTN|nr:TauD/TfdA family dioxygenase [Kitasatospora cheerisanensis]KDN82718.1 putative gamma-butyrobetaine dioxygenase [Kitasatospora cheerisanensis KCTC 2395]